MASRRPLLRLPGGVGRPPTAHAPDGLGLDDLSILGPISVLKLKFAPDVRRTSAGPGRWRLSTDDLVWRVVVDWLRLELDLPAALHICARTAR